MGKEEQPAKAIVQAVVTGGAAAAPLGPIAALQAGALSGGVEIAKQVSGALLVALLKNPDHRLAEEWERGQAAEIAQKQEILENKIDRLLEATGYTVDTANNILATFAVWSKARTQTADPKKARLLMGALLKSFDPDVYREGLTASLLKIIASLDYGDMYLLKCLATGGGLDERLAKRFLDDSASMELTLLQWHSDRLLSTGLARTYRHGDGSFNPKSMSRTRIGDKLLVLVGSDAFDEAEQIST
jgi:hypothetical protein